MVRPHNLRRMNSLVTQARLVGVSLGVLAVFTCSSAASDKDDPRNALAATWRAQRSEIVTASCKMRLFRFHEKVAKRRVTRAELAGLWESVDVNDIPRFVAKVSAVLGWPPAGGKGAVWGQTVEILEEGEKVKNHWRERFLGLPGSQSQYAFNGSEEVRYEQDHRQADIIAGRSGIELFSTGSLRFIPHVDHGEKGENSSQILSRSNGAITLRRGAWEITADEKSGLVRHALIREENDTVTADRYQFWPIKSAGGIAFPALSVKIAYHGGVVTWLDMYQVLEASFNSEVPADGFRVAVPKGTNILDHRSDRTRPSARVTRESIPDVLSFTDAGGPEETGGNTGGHRAILWWTAGGLSALCVILAVRKWYKANRMK